MSLRARLSTAFVLTLALGSVPCLADTLTFSATLNGASQVPANSSTGTGSGSYQLNGNLFTVTETFSGLSGPVTGAHIHCCASTTGNAAVVIPFAGFPAATSGTYMQTFDLSTFAFGGGITEAQFIAGLESGLAYANIHDANFPGGEIRGQILPVSTTPEPSSLILLGTGSLAALGMVRRRFVRA